MKFLVDTNVISEIMKPKPETCVKEWLIRQNLIAISVITVEEIYYGLLYKDAHKQLTWFEEFTQFRTKILPITQVIANRSGTLRAKLRCQGITKSQADMLIAATAQEHNLILATRNIKDFENCNIQLFNPFSRINIS